LKGLGKSTLEHIQTCRPAAGKISLAADKSTSPNKLEFFAIEAYWILDSWQTEEVPIGFEEIRGSHTRANMTGRINHVLARYGSQDTILGFTTHTASNISTLSEALNNAWSLLSVA